MNYTERLAKAMLDGQIPVRPGTVSHTNVCHDDWCGIYKGGACNCVPDIIVTHKARRYAVDENGDTKELS